ncbi:unnamed protein product [Phytomonas sp. Hart1]|nr:unnamed protein product [Phytomonas sp. Hart1]|eukprot:CCW69021.1 unnamed protein product [Phytomonas sp. isolate Hart1]
MAGKFRGDVGKLTKPKKNRASLKLKKSKVTFLVKRSPKLTDDVLHNRLAELTNGSEEIKSSKAPEPSKGVQKKPVGKAAIEIVGKTKEKFVPEEAVAPQRTTAEAIGLKILHRAVKSQGHNRLLPHQNRHDFEYRLRTVATMGVVRLFNSLAQARRASSAIDTDLKYLTADKLNERKQTVSKEAFLEALRQ